MTPAGTDSTTGGEVEDARDTDLDQLVGSVLGGGGRRGHDADRHVLGAHDLSELGERAHAYATDHGVDLGGIDVDDAGDRESALVEAAVPGERLAEVAGADDHDRPFVFETELTPDLVHEVVDLVADATRAVAAEVRQVLADLGGVDTGQFGETV